MNKKVKTIDLYQLLSEINADKCVNYLREWQLEVILETLPYTEEVDILLENMIYDMVEREYYEYAQVIKNVIDRRKIDG